MAAGLAGDLPVYYSQVLVGAGLERLPVHSGPCGCWVRETPCTFRSLWVLG